MLRIIAHLVKVGALVWKLDCECHARLYGNGLRAMQSFRKMINNLHQKTSSESPAHGGHP